MKHRTLLTAGILAILALSAAVSAAGLMPWGDAHPATFVSLQSGWVQLDGQGLYARDSVSVAAQGRASDLVTLVLGLPLLAGSLWLARRGSLRGELLLTGTLGFFLYTYMSYTFLWTYNRFFLVYVALFSLSLFCFVAMVSSLATRDLAGRAGPGYPHRFLAGFQIGIAMAVGLLWLGRLAPAALDNTVPAGLDHYTTFVIQGMDLAIVVPAALLSGFLLLRKSSLGYLMTPIIVIKSVTMLTAIAAMMANQARAGVELGAGELLVFPLFLALSLAALWRMLGTMSPEAI